MIKTNIKLLIITIVVIYGFFIFKFPDIKILEAIIPLVTTIITFVICSKSEKFSFNIKLDKKTEKTIGVFLEIYNSTTDTYRIHNIKIDKLPQEIINDEIIPPNLLKHIEISIDGALSSKLKYVKAKLYITKDVNNKLIKFPGKRILNPYFETTEIWYYKFKKIIKGVFKI